MIIPYEVIQRPKLRAVLPSSTSVFHCHSRKGSRKKHQGFNIQVGP